MNTVNAVFIPKSLRPFSALIEDVDDERKIQNGYWVYLVYGWKSGSDPLGVEHQIHENTIGECARALKDVMRCDCEDCKRGTSK